MSEIETQLREYFDATVERVTAEIIATGSVSHALLGITGDTAYDTTEDGGSAPVGVNVREVTPTSAADAAGVAVGDIITAVDGTDVLTMDELITALRHVGAGDLAFDIGSHVGDRIASLRRLGVTGLETTVSSRGCLRPVRRVWLLDSRQRRTRQRGANEIIRALPIRHAGKQLLVGHESADRVEATAATFLGFLLFDEAFYQRLGEVIGVDEAVQSLLVPFGHHAGEPVSHQFDG